MLIDIASFLPMPLYTSSLTKADDGLLELMNAVLELAALLPSPEWQRAC